MVRLAQLRSSYMSRAAPVRSFSADHGGHAAPPSTPATQSPAVVPTACSVRHALFEPLSLSADPALVAAVAATSSLNCACGGQGH
jgi:hypothetical protein